MFWEVESVEVESVESGETVEAIRGLREAGRKWLRHIAWHRDQMFSFERAGLNG
jgi:hypothetical protein